jgi:hypothetical protein
MLGYTPVISWVNFSMSCCFANAFAELSLIMQQRFEAGKQKLDNFGREANTHHGTNTSTDV